MVFAGTTIYLGGAEGLIALELTKDLETIFPQTYGSIDARAGASDDTIA